jgi:hypothetical protein
LKILELEKKFQDWNVLESPGTNFLNLEPDVPTLVILIKITE